MADFFNNLTRQALGAAPEVRPLLPTRFAFWPGIRTAEVAPRPQEPAEAPARADAAPFPLPLIDPDGTAVDATLPSFWQMSKPGSASGSPAGPDQPPIAQGRPETSDFEQDDVRSGVALPVRPTVDDAPPSASPEAPASNPTPTVSVIQEEADSDTDNAITAVSAPQPEAGQKRSASSARLPDQPARLGRPLNTRQAEPVEAESVKGQPDTRLDDPPARADAAHSPVSLIDPNGPTVDASLPSFGQMRELGSASGPPVRPRRPPVARDSHETADFEQGGVRQDLATPVRPAVDDASPSALPAATASSPMSLVSVIQADANSDTENALIASPARGGASGDRPPREMATTERDAAVPPPSSPAPRPAAGRERSPSSARLPDPSARMGRLLRSSQAESVEAEPAETKPFDRQPEPVEAPHTLQSAALALAPVVKRLTVSGDKPASPPAAQPVSATEPDLPVSTQAGATPATTTVASTSDSLESAPPAGRAAAAWHEPAIEPAPGEVQSTKRAEAGASLRPPSARQAIREPEPAPTVRVTIGRVAVRAAPAAERPPSRRVELPRPPLSLEAYLRGRQGGAR